MDLKSLISRPAAEAPMITIFGEGGTGKTTLAALFPAPIFIRAEDGFDVFAGKKAPNAFPVLKSGEDIFSQLAADAEKNQKNVQRIRRENVTEMILESISDFTRAPFCEACEGAVEMSAADALDTARRLEGRAERYYREAAGKLKALPEVARGLKQIGKKRNAHLKQLESI